MKAQNQIKRVLRQEQSIELVQELLESQSFQSRDALALAVCEQFGFFDSRGKAQRGGCIKALRELEAAGHFQLPASRHSRSSPKSPIRLNEPVPEPVDVPEKASEIKGLHLKRVTEEEEMRIWNEMMITEHPRGAAHFAGRRFYYLIGSDHGWLGGLAFAASARHMADRDEWIGWDDATRREYRNTIVGMSRFLIRPSVHCRNLASKVLRMGVEIMVEDYQEKYQETPLLVETFVDTTLFSGVCYRAANWIRVGFTKGRGRQDRKGEYSETRKAIFVYLLDPDFRERLGLPKNAGGAPLEIGEGLENDQWAENEFGGAPLGDKRWSQRLVKIANLKTDDPGRAFTGVARGDWKEAKAYYRFIEEPDDSAVNMSSILAPHRKRTARRMRAQRTVLCIQDGTDLDFNNLTQCKGLGEIGSNQTGAKSKGLHLHSTIAVAPTGLPLGVLRAQCFAPETKPEDDDRSRKEVPIEEKETFCWIEGHRDMVELAEEMPKTKLIDVCDREGDFFELFDEQRKNPKVELLVRAQHNRRLQEKDLKLFESVRNSKVQSRVQVFVERQSERAKKSKQQARPKRSERNATLAIRYQQVEIRPPEYHTGKDPIKIWVIHAEEENPPKGESPTKWYLLTTMEIASPKDAEQFLSWYCLRWRIEDWHRVLKSGCKITEVGHKTADRLCRAIAINLVVGWRIMLFTLLGRECPKLPADVLFSDVELKVLAADAKKKGMKAPENLGEAVNLVAKLGGYLGRKHDPPPGHQIMWQGYTLLRHMAMGFALREETGE